MSKLTVVYAAEPESGPHKLQAGRRFGALEIVNPFVAAAHEGVATSAAPRGRGRRQAD